jgi:hypothetical protein
MEKPMKNHETHGQIWNKHGQTTKIWKVFEIQLRCELPSGNFSSPLPWTTWQVASCRTKLQRGCGELG